MASFTIEIPDKLIALYEQRKLTCDTNALSKGAVGFPQMRDSEIQQWVKDYVKGIIRRESWRLEREVNGTIVSDEALMESV